MGARAGTLQCADTRCSEVPYNRRCNVPAHCRVADANGSGVEGDAEILMDNNSSIGLKNTTAPEGSRDVPHKSSASGYMESIRSLGAKMSEQLSMLGSKGRGGSRGGGSKGEGYGLLSSIGMGEISELSPSDMRHAVAEHEASKGSFEEEIIPRTPKKRHRLMLNFITTLERIPSTRLQLIIENTRDIEKFYTLEKKVLGSGSFGSVKRATVRATGAPRAVKCILKQRMIGRMDILKKEIEITKMVDHPNIIKLYEIFEDTTNLYLVMELCLGGQLLDRVIKGSKLTEVHTAIVMQQILRAVYYLHKNHICHRDLKPENCLLLSASGVEGNSLKVTDFGLSCVFQDGVLMTAQVGTSSYMAPQVVTRSYDHLCDLWSCGVILYMLLCGYLPFKGDKEMDTRSKVATGKFSFRPSDWLDISQEAMDLICKLLTFDPKLRCTSKQALEHEWLIARVPKPKEVAIKGNILTNLGTFRAQNAFKRAALHLIVSLLGEEQLRDPYEILTSLDADGDGNLSVAELAQRLTGQAAKNLNQVAELFKDADNDEGVIEYTYTEFLAATFDRERYISKEVCRQAFSVFDQDGDGKLSTQELSHGGVLGKLTAEDLLRLVEDLDEDGDGEIDFEEFMQMMRKDSDASVRRTMRRRSSRELLLDSTAVKRFRDRVGDESLMGTTNKKIAEGEGSVSVASPTSSKFGSALPSVGDSSPGRRKAGSIAVEDDSSRSECTSPKLPTGSKKVEKAIEVSTELSEDQRRKRVTRFWDEEQDGEAPDFVFTTVSVRSEVSMEPSHSGKMPLKSALKKPRTHSRSGSEAWGRDGACSVKANPLGGSLEQPADEEKTRPKLRVEIQAPEKEPVKLDSPQDSQLSKRRQTGFMKPGDGAEDSPMSRSRQIGFMKPQDATEDSLVPKRRQTGVMKPQDVAEDSPQPKRRQTGYMKPQDPAEAPGKRSKPTSNNTDAPKAPNKLPEKSETPEAKSAKQTKEAKEVKELRRSASRETKEAKEVKELRRSASRETKEAHQAKETREARSASPSRTSETSRSLERPTAKPQAVADKSKVSKQASATGGTPATGNTQKGATGRSMPREKSPSGTKQPGGGTRERAGAALAAARDAITGSRSREKAASSTSPSRRTTPQQRKSS